MLESKTRNQLKKSAIIKIRIAQAAGLCFVAFNAFFCLIFIGMAWIAGAKNFSAFFELTTVLNCVIVVVLIVWLQWKSRIASILLFLHLIFVVVDLDIASRGFNMVMVYFMFLGFAYTIGIKGTVDYNKLKNL